ncbi:hypothetical protein BD413DRAFT_680086 [Trametes elegans]|nr:hypothetical protein BD413DRAFT_680086 [Trametes elegans]
MTSWTCTAPARPIHTDRPSRCPQRKWTRQSSRSSRAKFATAAGWYSPTLFSICHYKLCIYAICTSGGTVSAADARTGTAGAQAIASGTSSAGCPPLRVSSAAMPIPTHSHSDRHNAHEPVHPRAASIHNFAGPPGTRRCLCRELGFPHVSRLDITRPPRPPPTRICAPNTTPPWRRTPSRSSSAGAPMSTSPVRRPYGGRRHACSPERRRTSASARDWPSSVRRPAQGIWHVLYERGCRDVPPAAVSHHPSFAGSLRCWEAGRPGMARGATGCSRGEAKPPRRSLLLLICSAPSRRRCRQRGPAPTPAGDRRRRLEPREDGVTRKGALLAPARPAHVRAGGSRLCSVWAEARSGGGEAQRERCGDIRESGCLGSTDMRQTTIVYPPRADSFWKSLLRAARPYEAAADMSTSCEWLTHTIETKIRCTVETLSRSHAQFEEDPLRHLVRSNSIRVIRPSFVLIDILRELRELLTGVPDRVPVQPETQRRVWPSARACTLQRDEVRRLRRATVG